MTIKKNSQPILIIEDSDDDFKATIRAFKKTNNLHNPIYRCEDGEEALDFLLHRGKFSNPEDAPRPGIILLDLNLPGLDGRKLLKEVKNEVKLKNIPIIVLTTSNDIRDIKDCYQVGANTYIKKPVDLDKFIEFIKQLKGYWLDIAILPIEEPNSERINYEFRKS